MTIRPNASPRWLRGLILPLAFEDMAREVRLMKEAIEEDVRWRQDTSRKLRALSAEMQRTLVNL